MSTSLPYTFDDMVSVDDVIDLNQDYLSEGRSSSVSAKEYRISLHSIDDDELRLFHRNLVTPVPSVCYSDDDNALFHKNMTRQRRFVPPSRVQRPPSRGESVMLFEKINNGDEDVTSFDLVSSELRDFMDTDYMMEGMLSRPVSRTTIAKNASKIQDINNFRTSLLEEQQPEKKDNINIKSPLMTGSNRKILSNTPIASMTGSKSHFNSYKSQEQPASRSMSSVPELSSKASYRYIDRHQQQQRMPSGTRDEYLYKKIPKRLVTMPKEPNSPRQKVNAKRQQFGVQQEKRQVDDTSVKNCFNRISAVRSFGRNQSSEPEAQLYYQHQATPRTTRIPGFSIPVSNHQNHYGSFYTRNRSDTTVTTTSSSSDEEPVEENGIWRDHPISHKTSQDLVTPQHRSSFSAVESSAINTPRMKHYNHLDTTESNFKSISNPRLRNMGSHKTFPIRNYHNTATTTTTVTEDEAVTDSAKQVLACIRERRKSSMMLLADHSPKLASSTRLINPNASSSQPDRPRHYLNPRQKNSNNRRVDFLADNDHRMLNTTTTRLPQRTVHR